MKILITDIDWDTDGENVYLPKQVLIDNPSPDLLADIEGDTGALADYLSDEYGFCVNGFESSLMVTNGWGEIRCDYLCEDDGFWRVDAWKTSDDNEEGKVIAYIDDLTFRVLYVDPRAMTDDYAQEVINDKIANLQDENPVWVDYGNGSVTMYMRTKSGILAASAEQDAVTENGYDAIFTGIMCPANEPVDLVSVRTHRDDNGLCIKALNDPEKHMSEKQLQTWDW